MRFEKPFERACIGAIRPLTFFDGGFPEKFHCFFALNTVLKKFHRALINPVGFSYNVNGRKYGIRMFVTVGVAVFNEKARKTEDSLSVIAKDTLVPLYHKKGVPARRSLPFC